MKEKNRMIVQSCDSRECRKKYKKEISEVCEAVTTVHELNTTTKIITCTECGKSYKLPK